MANIARYRVNWTGAAVVGPSVSTFYTDEAATGFLAALHNFYNSIKASFPDQLTWTFESSGDLLDVATGAITGSWNDSSQTPITGNIATGWAEGVGMRVKWRSSGIVNGRRSVGSTFLVPLGKANFDNSGALADAVVDLVQTAADTLVTNVGADMRVWHRPVNGAGGSAAPVISAVVPDAVSWLRSRRT